MSKKSNAQMMHNLICGAFFLIFVGSSYGQSRINDEMVQRFREINNNYNVHQDTVRLFKELNAMTKQVSISDKVLAEALAKGYRASNYVMIPSKVSEALSIFEEVIPIIQKSGRLDEVAFFKLRIGSIFLDNADTENAQEMLEEARQLLKQYPDERTLLTSYSLAAFISNVLRDTISAVNYHHQSIALAKKLKHNFALALAYQNLGNMYRRGKDYIKATEYLNQALAIQQKYGYNTAGTFTHLAHVFLAQKNYTEAEDIIWKSIKAYEQAPSINTRFDGIQYVQLGDIYMAQKKYDQAKIAYDRAIDITTKSGMLVRQAYAHSAMAIYYETLGNYKKAYQHMTLAAEYIESSYLTTSNEKVQQKEALYKLKEKNQTIEQLEKDAKTQRWFLGMAGLIIVGAGAFIYSLRRQNKLQKQISLLKQQRLQEEVAYHQRELFSNALYIDQRNELLNELKAKLLNGENPNVIVKTIDKSISAEEEWEKFKMYFDKIQPAFFDKLLKIEPRLTDLEQKQCAYLRLNLTPKQVANLLNVTPHAVSTARTHANKGLK